MPEMGRCRDCRWWEPRGPVWGGSCAMVRTLPSLAHVTFLHEGSELMTDPEFGCIQFEQRGRVPPMRTVLRVVR